MTRSTPAQAAAAVMQQAQWMADELTAARERVRRYRNRTQDSTAVYPPYGRFPDGFDMETVAALAAGVMLDDAGRRYAVVRGDGETDDDLRRRVLAAIREG